MLSRDELCFFDLPISNGALRVEQVVEGLLFVRPDETGQHS